MMSVQVISLDQTQGEAVAEMARTFLHIDKATVFEGLNATQALAVYQSRLPLYTQWLIGTQSRHDHMQLGTGPMLGCLASHVQLWEQLAQAEEEEEVVVLEEDALLSEASTQLFQKIRREMLLVEWDIVMLEKGQIISRGQWEPVGTVLQTCRQGTLCNWFGTRGYILSKRGALKLLKHVHPIVVQVDALIGLVAAFDRSFKMYWPREDLVQLDYGSHVRHLRVSRVWDACIKCYMPTQPTFYLIIPCLLLLYGAYQRLLGGHKRQSAHLLCCNVLRAGGALLRSGRGAGDCLQRPQ